MLVVVLVVLSLFCSWTWVCVSLAMLSNPGGVGLFVDAVPFLTSLLLLFCASTTALSVLQIRVVIYV